jgi:thioredoxin reductase
MGMISGRGDKISGADISNPASTTSGLTECRISSIIIVKVPLRGIIGNPVEIGSCPATVSHISPQRAQKIFLCKKILLCVGTTRRKINIQGEKVFLGKGVSYCTTCDGMFFKDKTIIVVGGSDSAAKAALYMSEISKKVYISYHSLKGQ